MLSKIHWNKEITSIHYKLPLLPHSSFPWRHHVADHKKSPLFTRTWCVILQAQCPTHWINNCNLNMNTWERKNPYKKQRRPHPSRTTCHGKGESSSAQLLWFQRLVFSVGRQFMAGDNNLWGYLGGTVLFECELVLCFLFASVCYFR